MDTTPIEKTLNLASTVGELQDILDSFDDDVAIVIEHPVPRKGHQELFTIEVTNESADIGAIVLRMGNPTSRDD